VTYDNEAIDGKIARFDCYIMFDTMRAQMDLPER